MLAVLVLSSCFSKVFFFFANLGGAHFMKIWFCGNSRVLQYAEMNKLEGYMWKL